MRPYSAHSSLNHRNLITKGVAQNDPKNVDDVAKIWTAFGKYLAKVIKSGKGVSIPKFGQFTFTPMKVDLAGSTNPDIRDKQIREPIFQVSQDFVLGLSLKSGVVNNQGALRPFQIQGTSGVVPKVRVNYTEIGYYAGLSKDEAKHGCDIVIRDLSDKVKSGQQTKLLIPNIGYFLCKSQVVGVKFNNDIVQDSQGKTSKSHFVNKLFSNSVNRANLEILDQKVSQGLRTRASNFNNPKGRGPVVGKHDNSLTVTPEAQTWMMNNLGINLDNQASQQNLHQEKPKPKMKRTFSARPGFRSNASERSHSVYSGQAFQKATNGAQQEEPLFKIRNSSKKRRPMSAISQFSKRSRASSAASRVPKMTRASALTYCNKIASNKLILEQVQSSKFNARDKLTPSEIQHILQNARIFMDIATVRGFLNHLYFSAHGKSCSILDLIRKSKEWSAGGPGKYTSTVAKATSLYTTEELVIKIRDVLFKTGLTAEQIFEIGCDDKREIDEEAFIFLMKKYCSHIISEEDSRRVFQTCARNLGRNVTMSDFQTIFGSVKPKANYHIQGLKLIRGWMYDNGLTSDQAFESLSGNKETMNLEHFEVTLKKFFKITSPEVESIFRAIDKNRDGLIDLDEWLETVYEDSANPLQLIREIVNEYNLNEDDLLFKMNLRIWDDPLDYTKFAKAMRNLDNSLTDVQLRALAKSLKNSKNLIDVPALVNNIVGKHHQTVDFRDKLYKKLFTEILESSSSRKQRMKDLLVKYDKLNDGTIVAQDLQKVLAEVSSLRKQDIERFTRFLEKDPRGRIDYTRFVDDLEKVKEHNPFKIVVSRIKEFMKQNNQDVNTFMRRLVIGESQTGSNLDNEEGLDKERKVSISYFAKFLKSKVAKKKDIDELNRYAELIDIDGDGYISIHDLNSCLGNLKNETFYQNNGSTLVGTFKTILSEREKFFPKDPLPHEKALEVVAKIKEALKTRGISYRALFQKLDANDDEFLTFTEFSENIEPIVKLSPIVKERLFALMDVNKIGMVDYKNFLDILTLTPVTIRPKRIEDNFDWEYGIVQKIKNWIIDEGITIEEAFKAFDRDFDGFIDKADLKWIVQNIIKDTDKPKINDSQLERLFKLLDFHKSGHIQKCDIQRLVENENPYLSTGKLTNSKFMVGTDTFDWKNNAIQQIGIELSKNSKFKSLKGCFKVASQGMGKIRYKDFKEFIADTNALKGFNLTDQLLQKLFSELDPHKKGFLSESDWETAFSGFNWFDQLVVELENLVSCSFSEVESAFEYFQVIGKSKNITKGTFTKSVNSLRGKKLTVGEADYLWNYFSDGAKAITFDRFTHVFSSLTFSGTSTLRKTGKSLNTTTLVNKTSSSTKWSKDVMEKFRKIIKSSNMHLREVFEAFDSDGNGYITPLEFRHAVRTLNINLSAREIDEIIKVVDRNMDGMIDWKEFSSKFKTKDNETLIETRSMNKMAKLKEQMTSHMNSPQDAFGAFDKSKSEKLSFANFNDLIKELSKLSGEQVPPFAIIKDLFDEIDIRKDGEIDLKEWNQTFLRVQAGDKRFSLKKIPQRLAEFEVNREARTILESIRRNRKFLMEKFGSHSSDGKHVSFEDAKEIVRAVQRGVEIDDDQYKIIFKGAIREGDQVEYKLLGRDLKKKFG